MKKFLVFLAVVWGILLLGVIGLMVLGALVGDQKPEAFFETVSAGDMAALEQMMSPLLRVQVDSAVLAAVVNEVRDVMGTYEGPGAEGFETKKEAGGITVLTGAARFSKGELPCELIYLKDKLLGFDIQSDEVVQGAFARPELLEAFQVRGRQFIESALGEGAESAYGLLNEDLQKQVSREQFDRVVSEALTEYGAFQSVSFAALKNEAVETGHLKIYYDMVFENASTTAQVDFGFKGMQASIWGFYFSM